MSEMKGLAEFEAAVESLTQAAVHGRLFRDYGDELTSVVIRMAKAGVGPEDKPYAPYSESYKKQLGLTQRGGEFGRHRSVGRIRETRKTGQSNTAARRAGNKFWLFSWYAPHMLDKARFALEVDKDGFGVVGWDGTDEQMNTYAQVHQGSEYGGADHTKGQIPARPWLHFDTTKSRQTLKKCYDLAIRSLVADLNQGKV